MDLLQFIMELDIQQYSVLKNMIPFATGLDTLYVRKKWGYDSLSVEERLTLHNVIILDKSVLNKIKVASTIIYFQKNVRKIQLNNNFKSFFVIIIVLGFGGAKVAEEKLYGTKRPIKLWYIDVNNIFISKVVETKTNSKCLIGYLEKVIRPLVLILSKMSRYV